MSLEERIQQFHQEINEEAKKLFEEKCSWLKPNRLYYMRNKLSDPFECVTVTDIALKELRSRLFGEVNYVKIELTIDYKTNKQQYSRSENLPLATIEKYVTPINDLETKLLQLPEHVLQYLWDRRGNLHLKAKPQGEDHPMEVLLWKDWEDLRALLTKTRNQLDLILYETNSL